MRDPYDVLGVSRSASAGDIKKAYRRLAKTLHPDRNKSDPKAAQKFAELNQAYEIVGDEKQRKRFDSGEIDAEGKQRFAGFAGFGGGDEQFAGAHPGFERFQFNFGPGGMRGARRGRGQAAGFEDLFSNLFGGDFGSAQTFTEATGKAPDASATLHLSFLEAARGTEKQIALSSGKTLKVSVPPGTVSGSVLRLKGQAGGASGLQPGDVLLKIEVAEHPFWKSEGNHLRLTLPVTLDEAVLGAKIRVPTLDGAVELTIPPNSNTGKTLRLKGKGIAGKGDLYVTLSVVLPPAADQELKDYAARLRAMRPYEVRSFEFDI